MNKVHASFMLLFALCLSFVCCAPSYAEVNGNGGANANAAASRQSALLAADAGGAMDGSSTESGGGNYDKRVERYAFGLGRRAYMYTNGGVGMKRLPVYNFGLGKRSAKPYSFGLGKRVNTLGLNGGDYDETAEYDGSSSNDFEHYNGGNYNAPSYELNEKRNRLYSFGLGKRQNDEVERRFPNRYGFGLGRR